MREKRMKEGKLKTTRRNKDKGQREGRRRGRKKGRKESQGLRQGEEGERNEEFLSDNIALN